MLTLLVGISYKLAKVMKWGVNMQSCHEGIMVLMFTRCKYGNTSILQNFIEVAILPAIDCFGLQMCGSMEMKVAKLQ